MNLGWPLMILVVAHGTHELFIIPRATDSVEGWRTMPSVWPVIQECSLSFTVQKRSNPYVCVLYLEENKRRKVMEGREFRYSTTMFRLLERLLARTDSLPIRGLMGEYCVKLAIRRLLGTYELSSS